MSSVGEALAGLGPRFPDAKTAVIAFSGGRDSHVLLHAAKRFATLPVRALHIAHGLQPSAVGWPQHCGEVCEHLEVPLTTVQATVELSGQGVEAAARAARYSAFAQQLQPDEILLQAHHADDQAETLMLRLLRGTGLRGLGAIPVQRALGQTYLWRPLLALSGDVLADYAEQQQLTWIEDPSNADLQFDRNYLRSAVMPQLARRWPNMATQLSAAARRASEAEQLLQQLLQPQLESLCAVDGSLSCDGLLALSSLQQRHLLRAWLARFSELSPSDAQLRAALRDVLKARRDSDPSLQLSGGQLRRHRDRLYWLPSQPEIERQAVYWSDPGQPLTVGAETLSLDSDFGQKLAFDAGSCLQIRFRQGGERIRLRGGERPLKKLLQDLGVPSWQRYSTPLLYIDGELAAVWNVSIAVKFEKKP